MAGPTSRMWQELPESTIGTIEPADAKELALEAQRLEEDFNSELDRIEHFANFLDDVDNYLLVTSIADVVPETYLVPHDLIACVDRDDLIGTIATAYVDRIVHRQLFEPLEADSGTNQQLFELPASEPEIQFAEEGEPFEPADVSWESAQCDRMKFRGRTIIGSGTTENQTLADLCEEFSLTLADRILDEIPEDVAIFDECTPDVVHELLAEIESRSYRPDVAIVGDDLVDDDGSILDVVDPIVDVRHISSGWLSDELVLGSAESFGYEVVWEGLDVSTDLETGALTLFTPVDVQLSADANWIAIDEDAIVRARIE